MKIKEKKRTKRIGIDARFYGPIGKGIGRYIQEIVDNVIKIDQDNEYIIFLSKDNFDEFICDGERVKKKIANIRWYGIAEQLFMPFLILRNRLDLMHFPHFNVPVFCPTKFVVTIHDLILTKFPTVRSSTLSPAFYKLKNLFYRIIIYIAVHRAREVIAVSEFTKKDIVEKFKISEKKVQVTYEGVANLAKGKDSLFVKKLDDKSTLLSYNIDSKFILYVGNAYPHKNLESLVEVFSDLHKKHQGLRLVLVGKEDYFYKRIKEIAAGFSLWHEDVEDSPVIFPGYVPDSELEILYKKAMCYVFPSLYEGFGLPPLEAMVKGCPVISSNSSSMPEILGDAAIYFNPKDKQEMIDKIEKVLDDPRLRETLIKKGKEQAKSYNWWEAARKTLEIYKNIL